MLILCQDKHMSTQFSYKLTDTDIYVHLLYRIHPKDARRLDEANVLDVVQESVLLQNKYLQHKECNILIFADTYGVIPEQGVGGRCGDSDLINIFIDPDHKAGLEYNVKTWLPSALSHELYHARRYVTQKFGETLGESLVEEGLPSMFEEFMQPGLAVPYAHHLEKEEIAKEWERAKKLLDSEDYDRDDWFYGGNGIKKWTGYSLGYDIVKQFMERTGEKNPAVLVDVPAKKFLESYSIS